VFQSAGHAYLSLLAEIQHCWTLTVLGFEDHGYLILASKTFEATLAAEYNIMSKEAYTSSIVCK
jgi:hypothetical protein